MAILRYSSSICFDPLWNTTKIYIPFDIFPTRCNITQFIYFWKTALHVLGRISTCHQEHTQLYLQYLVFVKPLLLPAAIVAGSSNGLTNTRYCKYSCVLLMTGGDTTQNMDSSFPEINKLRNVASCWKYIKRNTHTMHGPLSVKFTHKNVIKNT